MYGASGKMGGGGGGGSVGKRNIHPPPINRAAPAPAGRLSMTGAPRGRGAAISSPSTSSRQVEESFSLVRENPLNFGMAIKLAPDLVEEIKRVEAQGGTARIKFDANANNPNGNVIQVGDKNFKFTWSREPGDLCDIYEERHSGEEGNGLLVESGGTWRKLNVERELDESTKNHVKRRSEEAERTLKSRKTIILDHQNPAMKNQMKAFAASESNQWRNFKQHRKEPPFKKPKSELTTGGPSKSVYKSGLPTTSLSKGRLSIGSPLPSQPEQHGASVSPIGSGDLVKGHGVSDVAAVQNMSKVLSSDKEIANRMPSSTISEKSKNTRNTEAKPADLRSLMISLLQEHQSKGLSLKALEKAIGDSMPKSARKIEPILKQIAVFQAPGRYFLKPGAEMDSFTKLPQIGSSPEINPYQSPAPQKLDQLSARDPSISTATAANDEEQAELNSMPGHTIDILATVENLPENLGDQNVSNNSGGMAGSSSDSGSDSDSDSDSDSSDSGSDSGSHRKSKSQSVVGSQSGSSSDSETDASSSSKQASDEDVDIMTSDDDKEPKHKLQDSNPIPLRNPIPWDQVDDESIDIGNYDMQDHHVSDVIEIEKDSPEDDHDAERPVADYSFANNKGEVHIEEIKPSSADYHEQQEREVFDRKTYDDGPDSVVNDGFKHGQSGTSERSSKGKSKRHFDDMHSDERTHNRKRSKSKNSSQQVSGAINSIFGESPYNSSPDGPQGLDEGPVDIIENRTTRDYSNDPDLQTGSNQVISTRPVSDSQQPGQRASEAHIRSEAPAGDKRLGMRNNVDHGFKQSESSLQTNEGLLMQKGFHSEAQSEDRFVKRWPLKFPTEGIRDKQAPVKESHNRKPEMMGKVKEPGPPFNSFRGYSPKDNNASTTDRSPLMNGRSAVLRREHSDLELGEFREPFHEDTPGSKKHFERKSSFKHLENKPMDSEYWNSDFSRGKTSHKITADSGRLTPPNSDAVVSSNPDGPFKRKGQENNFDDLAKTHQRSTRPLDPHHQSSLDHVDSGSQQITVPEMTGKSRFAEAGTVRGPSMEAYGDTSRKMPVNSTEQLDPIRGVGPRGAKEIKKQKPKMVGVSNDRQIDTFEGSNDGGRKRKVSSSDEDISLYTKYEKEEPELKGPVKDLPQYKEYVKEYQEKYESYCSLSKFLESYSTEFSKLGKDLEACKGRDTKKYFDILEQMRSSFRQCGERHKRLKKIFLVLYEELNHLKQMLKDYAETYKKD